MGTPATDRFRNEYLADMNAEELEELKNQQNKKTSGMKNMVVAGGIFEKYTSVLDNINEANSKKLNLVEQHGEVFQYKQPDFSGNTVNDVKELMSSRFRNAEERIELTEFGKENLTEFLELNPDKADITQKIIDSPGNTGWEKFTTGTKQKGIVDKLLPGKSMPSLSQGLGMIPGFINVLTADDEIDAVRGGVQMAYPWLATNPIGWGVIALNELLGFLE